MSTSRFSTNDRFRIRLLRLGLAPLGRLAPPLAARLLARTFAAPPRQPLSAEQREWLATGRSERMLVGGRQAIVTIWGTPGPVALLVHGWAGRGTQLAPYIRPLLDAGFRVVAYDAPAHGAAPGRTTHLPELIATLRAVARRFPPHVLVAHSVGAVAATVAMAEDLAPHRAVFLAPADDPWAFLERIASLLGLRRPIALRVRRAFESRLGLSVDDLVASRRAPATRTELLVFHDVADREVPVSDGERLAAAWPGARLETTRGLGHRRILGDPLVVARAVDFLSRRPAADSAARPRPRARATW